MTGVGRSPNLSPEQHFERLLDNVIRTLEIAGYEVNLVTSLTDRKAELEITPRLANLPTGLCPDKGDHNPHMYDSISLGTFLCTADQATRLPWAAESRRNNEVNS